MSAHTIRSISRLRHVVAVDRHGSYSRAASTLGLSQSALSRSIQTMEDDLGVILFERDAKGVRATPSGGVFIRHATTLLAATDDLETSMRRLRRNQGVQVSFGIGPMPASVILPDLFIERAQAAAAGRLRAHTETGMLLRNLLESTMIDFIVCAEGAITARPNLKIRPIGKLPITVRVRPGHPLLNRTPVTAEDLSMHPMIGSGLPPALSDQIMPGSIIYDPHLACDDYAILAKVAASSDAYGLFPAQLSTPELVDLPTPPDLIPPHIPMLLIEDRERPLSPSAQAVADRIEALLRPASDANDAAKADV